MMPAILIIILLFIAFAGSDLLAYFRQIWLNKESGEIRKLLLRPPSVFEEKRRLMEPVLLKHIDFYRHLSPVAKVKFLYRCAAFMQRKRFIGKEELEITEEMKVLISAAAVQLTFGLREFQLQHFNTIIVYPGVYTSPLTGANHLGETSIKGVIVLSWQHFLEGYQSNSDKINLGLHEMAHALDLSRMVKASDPFFHAYFVKWHAVAGDTFNEVNQEEEHFLRKYSGTNDREFFAVSVEHFFEDPQEFKKNLPHLYRHLSILLRQDPVALGLNQHTLLSWVSNQPTWNKQDDHVMKHFQSDFPFWYATKWMMLPLGFFILISAVNSGEDLRFATLLLTSRFFIGVIQFFFRSRIVEVINNFVVVRSAVFPFMTKSFAMENIISIRYDLHRKGSVHLVYLQEGEVHSAVYPIGLSREDYESFKNAMSNKDVSMSY